MNATTLRRSPTAVGAVLLAAAALAGSADPRLFFAVWLAAWWFCLGVTFGAVANQCIHRLTGGAWGEALRPAAALFVRPLPWLLLLFLPLLAGLQALYPWAGQRRAWQAAMDQPQFASIWFSPLFFGLRLAGYGVLLGWLAGRRRSTTSAAAAAALAVYMLVGSLMAFDLLMALVAGWTSTVFGWLATIGQMATGTAAAIAWAARDAKGAAPRPPSAGPKQVPVWRDLGNLLLMVLMLQAYLQFMQFLIIWAENLPREISWFLPRLRTGWRHVGLALVLLQFALPVSALLFRRIKDDPRRLAVVARGVLAAQALESLWLVVPSVEPHGWSVWWLAPLTFGGMALLLSGRAAAAPRSSAARLAADA